MEKILVIDSLHGMTGIAKLIAELSHKHEIPLIIDEDTDMGSLNRGVGMRTLAVALLTGLASGFGEQAGAGSPMARMQGDLILSQLRYHHKGIRSSRPSGAAAAKRASVKRRNVLKRKSKRA